MGLSRLTRSAALAAACLLAMLARPIAAQQQTGTVRGTVTDSTTGRGVPTVRVTVSNGSRATVTDDQGRYTLAGVSDGAVTVSFQRIGFAPASHRTTVTVGQVVTVDAVLRAVAATLSEVVTIGYGTTSRANVTSAIATIDSTTIRNVPVVSLDNAFQGKIPGVQVMQNAGEPGAAVSVRVRGPASLNAGNQPLYVVDGVPIIQDTYEQLTSTSGQRVSPVSTINPDDIERIDVLKDAAATAIYGSRGSNGVVLITTKRGGVGNRMHYGLSTYGGSQSIERKIGLLNATQYVTVMNEARTNQGLTPRYTLGVTDTASYDWQDAIYRSAGISDIALSMSGGNDRLRTFISGSNFQQTGIVIGSRYRRQAVRVNADVNATSRLTVATSIGLTREDNDRVPGDLNVDGVVTNALAEQPFNPIYGTSFGFGGTNENLLYSNPVATATYSKVNTGTLRALGNLETRLTLTDRLNLTGRFGADIYGVDELRWRSPKVDGASGASVGGQGADGHTTVTRYLMEGFGNVDLLSTQSQRLTLTAGSSVEYNRSTLSYVSGQGFPSGFDTYVRTAASINDYDGSATSNNLASFFSRATWSMLDRYQLAASLRADGSSRFGSANRWGVFPALSAGWLVTDEGFASGLSRFGTLKLRASVGTTGNQGIGDFASRTLAGSSPYNSVPGVAPAQLGNADLKWEQTREVDFGADVTTLGGRLGIIVDQYTRNTSNLLVQRPVPATSGYTSVWDNVGSLRNSGVDLGIHTVNIESKTGGFGWTSDLNVTWNNNKVTNLYAGQPITFTTSSRVTSVAAVGQPLGTFYLFKFARVDPATGNALYLKADGVTETTAPTSSDLQFVGNPQPKYYGGFTNTVSFGDFDLRGFFQFSQGGKVLNLMRIFTDDGGAVSDNKTINVLNRWQKAGDITDVPRMGSTSGARLLSSRFVEDGSFVRFGELTLGYKLPSRLLAPARLENARLFVSGRNLKTWTNYSGYNPDVNSTASSNVVMGVDYYAYPLARTFTVGVNAGW